MKRSPRPRKTAELSKSLQQQLNMYALAAGAAGVSLLALAAPSEAKIVYTPTKVSIGSLRYGSHYGIDLDHDGTPDVYLGRSAEYSTSVVFASAYLNTGNGVAATQIINRSWAAAIVRGARIGPAMRFVGSRFSPGMASVGQGSTGAVWTGPWADGGKGLKNRYLGIKFTSEGQVHYGWARVSVIIDNPKIINVTGVVLTGYAYETIPNKPIIAGQTKGADVTTVSPASLGHLAAGASAIPAWRSGK